MSFLETFQKCHRTNLAPGLTPPGHPAPSVSVSKPPGMWGVRGVYVNSHSDEHGPPLVGVRAQERAYSHALISQEGGRTGKLMPPDYWQRPVPPGLLAANIPAPKLHAKPILPEILDTTGMSPVYGVRGSPHGA
jgi:hypothetical protein